MYSYTTTGLLSEYLQAVFRGLCVRFFMEGVAFFADFSILEIVDGNEFDGEFCDVCHVRKGGKMSGAFLIMLVGIGLIVVSFTALLLSQEPPDKPKLKYGNDFFDASLWDDDDDYCYPALGVG